MKIMPTVFTLTAATSFFTLLAPMQAQQKKRDYQDGIGFLKGRWNAREIVHYPLLISGAGTFDGSNFHAVITIKNKVIVINVVQNEEASNKNTFYGKINGNDLDSIKWTFPDGAAAEVYITPDHEHVHIYMPLSYEGRREPHAQEIILSR